MRGGFMLVTVLIVTAVGLLFGAGALLLFRFQCQMRIDRQHELEKVYAVRSTLNYIRVNSNISDGDRYFGFRTWSGRDLGLIAKPVEPVFPDYDNPRHFVMEKGHFTTALDDQYDPALDFEFGVEGTTNALISNVNHDGNWGLAVKDLAATNNVKWWVNIGMPGTGGWLQEDYGRRYYFWPQDFVDGEAVKDVMRLCIIRNVTNESNHVGRRHGWPLSVEGERALVFQITPMAGNIKGNNAEMALYEYVYMGGSVVSTNLIRMVNCPSVCYMGMQVASNKITIFYIGNEAVNVDTSDKSRGYTFAPEAPALSADTYSYFAEEVAVGGKMYGGIYTNDYGQVNAPELRAVFEFEAASDKRNGDGTLDNSNIDYLTNFRVTPAYQYDIFIEHPDTVTNRATVAQRIGQYDRFGLKYTVLTYDTHGTEHKGFRRDEREAERGGYR